MTPKEIVGGSGCVTVSCIDEQGKPSPVVFQIAPLSIAGELALEAELKSLVQTEQDTTRDRQLASVGAIPPGESTWAHNQFISDVVGYVMAPINGMQVNQVRHSLAGVRTELFHRASPSNPKLTRDHVNAVVTLETYNDILGQISKIISARKDHTKS